MGNTTGRQIYSMQKSNKNFRTRFVDSLRSVLIFGMLGLVLNINLGLIGVSLTKLVRNFHLKTLSGIFFIVKARCAFKGPFINYVTLCSEGCED